MKKINFKKELLHILLTIIAALISSFTFHIFVYGNNFAPIGVDGIATMLQAVTHINAGIFSFIINLPLLIAAWFILNRKYVIYTLLFTAFTSITLIILEKVEFYQYIVDNERLLVSVVSGALLGVRTGIMLKMGASSGGIDIISCIVTQKLNRDVEKIISLLCYVIIGISYFVYHDLTSILLSVVQMFIFEKAVSFVLKDSRNAVKFEIITKEPEKLRDDIIFNLKHGATIVNSKGMFTGDDSSIVVTIINNRQVPEFIEMIKKYENCFVYYSDVAGVKGNFRWNKEDIAK